MRVSIPILLALTIGCATGAALRDVVAPARAQGQIGPSYEYDAVWVADVTHNKEALTKYGREGWRLAAASQTSVSGTNLFFERQLTK